MKLVHRYLKGHGAADYWVQVQHDKNAIETAIGMIRDAATRELAGSDLSDPFREMMETSQEWVVETLIQGAYIREYHLWEKNLKEYVNLQYVANESSNKFVGGGNFIVQAQERLGHFDLAIPLDVRAELDAMRQRVNTAKHDPGILESHFVSTELLFSAFETILRFWEFLTTSEEFRI